MKTYSKSTANLEPRISILNSFQLQYAEADRVMIIPVDLRSNKPELSLNASWDYPHNADMISEDKQTTILGNVLDYLSLEGYSAALI